MERLPLIVLLQQFADYLLVVYVSGCGLVFLYELRAFVHLCMLLVAVDGLATLLRLTGIDILMAFLCLLGLLFLLAVTLFCIPESITVALLDDIVHLTTIALARSRNKRGIYNLTLVKTQPFLVKEKTEIVEQRVKRISLHQILTASLNGLLVLNITNCLYAKELTRVCTVNYLIFYLVVTKP